MSERIDASLKSRFAGAMLGTFVGDALGMPFEGMPPRMVRMCWSRKRPMMGDGRYTDDTQMMIGVAESLAHCRGFDGADMARRFVENFEPGRGYGATIGEVLAALREGCPWDKAATVVFAEGSYGNGAAMRVAPVGLLFHRDEAELRRVAEQSALITHAHPLGREGAALQAFAVASALQIEPGRLDPQAYLTRLRRFVHAEHEEFHGRLAAIAELITARRLVEDVVSVLGNDVRIHTAVPAAIYAFLSHAESFRDAVVQAVLLGGDTDTIAAMAGAIAGACHGIEGIPQEWVEALENTGKGRDYVLDLSGRLHDQYAFQQGV